MSDTFLPGETLLQYRQRMTALGVSPDVSRYNETGHQIQDYVPPVEKTSDDMFVVNAKREEFYRINQQLKDKFVSEAAKIKPDSAEFGTLLQNFVLAAEENERVNYVPDSNLNLVGQVFVAGMDQRHRDWNRNAPLTVVNDAVNAASIGFTVASLGFGGAGAAKIAADVSAKLGSGLAKGAAVGAFAGLQAANFYSNMNDMVVEETLSFARWNRDAGLGLTPKEITAAAQASGVFSGLMETFDDTIIPVSMLSGKIISGALKGAVAAGGKKALGRILAAAALNGITIGATEIGTELIQQAVSDGTFGAAASKQEIQKLYDLSLKTSKDFMRNPETQAIVYQAYMEEWARLNAQVSSEKKYLNPDQMDRFKKLEAFIVPFNEASANGSIDYEAKSKFFSAMESDFISQIDNKFRPMLEMGEAIPQKIAMLQQKEMAGPITDQERKQLDALVRAEYARKNIGLRPEAIIETATETAKAMVLPIITGGLIGGATMSRNIKTGVQMETSAATASATVTQQRAMASEQKQTAQALSGKQAPQEAVATETAPQETTATEKPVYTKKVNASTVIDAAFVDHKTGTVNMTDSILNQIASDFRNEARANESGKKSGIPRRTEETQRFKQVLDTLMPGASEQVKTSTMDYIARTSGEEATRLVSEIAKAVVKSASISIEHNGDTSFRAQTEEFATSMLKSASMGEQDAQAKIEQFGNMVAEVYGEDVRTQFMSRFGEFGYEAGGVVTADSVESLYRAVYDSIGGVKFIEKAPQVAQDLTADEVNAALSPEAGIDRIQEIRDSVEKRVNKKIDSRIKRGEYRAAMGESEASIAETDRRNEIALGMFEQIAVEEVKKVVGDTAAAKKLASGIAGILKSSNIVKPVKVDGKTVYTIQTTNASGKRVSAAKAVADNVQRSVRKLMGYQSGISDLEQIAEYLEWTKKDLEDFIESRGEAGVVSADDRKKLAQLEQAVAGAKKSFDDESKKSDESYRNGIGDLSTVKEARKKLDALAKKLQENPGEETQTQYQLAKEELSLAEEKAVATVASLVESRHEVAEILYKTAMKVFGPDVSNPSVAALKHAMADRAVTAMRLKQAMVLKEQVAKKEAEGIVFFSDQSKVNTERYNDWYKELTVRKTAYEMIETLRHGPLSKEDAERHLKTMEGYMPQEKTNREKFAAIRGALEEIVKTGALDDAKTELFLMQIRDVSDYEAARQSIAALKEPKRKVTLEQIDNAQTAEEEEELRREYERAQVAARLDEDIPSALATEVGDILSAYNNEGIVTAISERDQLRRGMEVSIETWNVIQARSKHIPFDSASENPLGTDESEAVLDDIRGALSAITADPTQIDETITIDNPTIDNGPLKVVINSAKNASKIIMSNLNTPERIEAEREFIDVIVPRYGAADKTAFFEKMKTMRPQDRARALSEIRNGLRFVRQMDDKIASVMVNAAMYDQLGSHVVPGEIKVNIQGESGVEERPRGSILVTNSIDHDPKANAINLKAMVDQLKNPWLEKTFLMNPAVINTVRQYLSAGYNVTVPSIDGDVVLTQQYVEVLAGVGDSEESIRAVVEYSFVNYQDGEMITHWVNKTESVRKAHERHQREKAMWKTLQHKHESDYQKYGNKRRVADKYASFAFWEIGKNGIPISLMDATFESPSAKENSANPVEGKQLSREKVDRDVFEKRFGNLIFNPIAGEYQINPSMSMENEDILLAQEGLVVSAKIDLQEEGVMNPTDSEIAGKVAELLALKKRLGNEVAYKRFLSRSSQAQYRATGSAYNQAEAQLMAAAYREREIEDAHTSRDAVSTTGSRLASSVRDSILNLMHQVGLGPKMDHRNVAKNKIQVDAAEIAVKLAYLKYRMSLIDDAENIDFTITDFRKNTKLMEIYEKITSGGYESLKPVFDSIDTMQEYIEDEIEKSGNAISVYIRLSEDRTVSLYTSGKKRGSTEYGATASTSIDPRHKDDVYKQNVMFEMGQILGLNSDDATLEVGHQSIIADLNKLVDHASNSIFLESIYSSLSNAKVYGGDSIITTAEGKNSARYTQAKARAARMVRAIPLFTVAENRKEMEFSRKGVYKPQTSTFDIRISNDVNGNIVYEKDGYQILDENKNTVFNPEQLHTARYISTNLHGAEYLIPIEPSNIKAIASDGNYRLVFRKENNQEDPSGFAVIDGIMYKIERPMPTFLNDSSSNMSKSKLARMIDGMFMTRDELSGAEKVLDSIGNFAVKTKALQLTSSLFHAIALTEGYIFQKISPFFYRDKNKPYLKQVVEMTGVGAAKSGYDVYFNGKDGLDSSIADLLVKSGLTIAPRDIEGDMSKRRLKAMTKYLADDMSPTSKLATGIGNQLSRYSDWVFNHLGTGLKINAAVTAFKHEVAKQARKGVTPDPMAIASKVANIVNANLGGVSFDRMGMSTTTRKFLKAFMFAPDWTLSNIKTLADGFRRGMQKTSLGWKTGHTTDMDAQIDALAAKGGVDLNAISTIVNMDSAEYAKSFRQFMGRWYMKSVLIGMASTAMIMAIAGDEEDNEEYWEERFARPFREADFGKLLLNAGATNITPLLKRAEEITGIDLNDDNRKFTMIQLAETFHREPRAIIDLGNAVFGLMINLNKGDDEAAEKAFREGMDNFLKYFTGKASTPAGMGISAVTKKNWKGDYFTFDTIREMFFENSMYTGRTFNSAMETAGMAILNPDEAFTSSWSGDYADNGMTAGFAYGIIKGFTPAQLDSTKNFMLGNINAFDWAAKVLGVRLEKE